MGRQSTAKTEARRRTSAPAAVKPRSRKDRTTGKSGAKSSAAPKQGAKPTAAPKSGANTTAKPARPAKARTGGKQGTAPTTSARPAGADRKPRTNQLHLLRSAAAHLRQEYARVSAHPLATYYLVLGAVLALTCLGLIMVLSASSITSYDGGEGSSFAYFNKQAFYAGIGLVLMTIASSIPLRLWRKLAGAALLLGLLMQAAVFAPGIGKAAKGNANWIQIGGFQVQPSEFLKLALAVWLGFILAQKFGKMTTFWQAMIPVVPAIGLVVGLVVAGNDLGTGLVLMGIALACLFVGGFPMKYFLLLGSGLAALTLSFILSSQNRLDRFTALFTGHAEQTATDITGQAWQSNHGLFSLASGGWFGVGLGASREKWSWLPEAHNDFIFAIIGEELGLLGSLAVLAMFAILAWGLVRVVLRSKDRFVQIATAGLFMWLIGQAAINIGVVAGILPVIGLPLPFVSYGGSSIIASLLAVGVILAFARTEKGADEAIRARREGLRASFAVLARKRKK